MTARAIDSTAMDTEDFADERKGFFQRRMRTFAVESRNFLFDEALINEVP